MNSSVHQMVLIQVQFWPVFFSLAVVKNSGVLNNRNKV